MADVTSCLATKLSKFVDLQDGDRLHLSEFEREEQSFPRHSEILTAGEDLDSLFVLKKGWAYSYVDMRDGRRQIVRIYLPGDIVGFEDMPSSTVSASFRTASPVVICPFEPDVMKRVFVESPRLAAILFALACREQSMYIARLRAVGRLDARERLIQALLDMLHGLRLTEDIGNEFVLPLSQTELGDFVGLTNVHVSKTLIRLEREGLIRRSDAGRIVIPNEATMERIIEYENRHQKLDCNWLPNR